MNSSKLKEPCAVRNIELYLQNFQLVDSSEHQSTTLWLSVRFHTTFIRKRADEVLDISTPQNKNGTSLATDWTTKASNFESRWGQEFLFLHVVQTGYGPTQPPVQWVLGDISLGVKQPGREAHLQLLPRSRKRGSIHPLPRGAVLN
jgi:hypothetical protein